MTIDADEFVSAVAYRRAVNAAPIESLEVRDGDTVIPLSPELRARWKFTGLNNWDFVTHVVESYREEGMAGVDALEKELLL